MIFEKWTETFEINTISDREMYHIQMSAISFSWINVTMCVTNSLSNVVSRRDFMQRYKVLQLSFHNFHNTIEVHLEEG